MEADLNALRTAAEVLRSYLRVYEAQSVEAAVAELEAARAAAKCPSCHGAGSRFYALWGMDTCRECRGTGRKSGD